MPAESKKFRRAVAIAEHHPEKLYKRNRSLLSMTRKQMHDFAATPERGLPLRKRLSHSQRRMRDRSTAASPPMSTSEIMCGYRKLGGK